MYENILVPVVFGDGPDGAGEDRITAAVDIARGLAKPGARITLLHVIEDIPPYVINYLPQTYLDESRKAIAATLTNRAAEIPGGVGVVVTGHSGRTILDWAEANSCDLIVVASHRPGMQDLLIGSTAAHIVRHAQCAVHVLR